jgi:hypothetical protein
MSEKISAILKRKLNDLAAYGEINAEMRRNALKEELQFYVLDFIYHHSEYNKWIMYGGSALRIIHDLDRMSVDLDFEISNAIADDFLEKLKKEIENHFANTYGASADFLTIKTNSGRGLLLKFNVGDELSFGHSSKQIHVKIDLNRFVAPKTVTEHRPINHSQLSFVILAYNMGALMASKIAAIFLREQRGMDKNIYDYKGRDIYDLLWYMSKKTVPDFDYLNEKLKEKGSKIPDIKALFDKLTIDILNYDKMDELLKADLKYLFENQSQFENWFKDWRNNYLRLLNDYRINTVTTLGDVRIHQNFSSLNFSFTYTYNTGDKKLVYIKYIISDYWIDFNDNKLPIEADKKLEEKIKFIGGGMSLNSSQADELNRYATLFYQKTEKYFKKTNHIMLGDSIITKVVRMTADNFNPNEQILLNKSALIKCELDDLLK